MKLKFILVAVAMVLVGCGNTERVDCPKAKIQIANMTGGIQYGECFGRDAE